MPRIHVLDKAVAELIAAGEVVERPASIVKELLENAVDAGAGAITVEIRGGGVEYLRVSDDGCGIEREDIPRAFLRHATSKVREAGDLDGIRTLGFRGEALASIAAMCRVELTTKTPEADEGVTCRVEDGEVGELSPAGCPAGTTIVVRDVFYNTPARMKFLKKDVSEGNSVALMVDKLALAHPEIAVHFIRDGATKLRTSGGGDLLAVIRGVYGKDLAAAMLPVEYEYEDKIRISGYISSPAGAKASRTYQNFFINRRYVRTRTACAALEEGFKQKLMGGRFPACVLNLDIDAGAVDVNVHPAKIEVRFVDEKPVFHAVYFAVKSALSQGGQETPAALPAERDPASARQTAPDPPPPHMTAREFRILFDKDGGDERRESAFSQPVQMHSSRLDIAVDRPVAFHVHRPRQVKADGADSFHAVAQQSAEPPHEPPRVSAAAPEPERKAPEVDSGAVPHPEQPLPPTYLIGEAFGTYIVLERGDELLLVDKHAAHERLLYEQIKQNLAYGNRQVLLSPQAVTLSRDDYDALLEGLDRAEEMGFLVEDFGGATVLVRETPIELGEGDIEHLIGEIAGKLRAGNRDLTPEKLDRLYYSIACRSAFKAGDKNHPVELAELVRRLEKDPEITHCPHGRPVTVKLTRHEVEKLFGRLG